MIYQLIAKLQDAPNEKAARELTLDIIEKLLGKIITLEDKVERLERAKRNVV